jgi:hypothetical protein
LGCQISLFAKILKEFYEENLALENRQLNRIKGWQLWNKVFNMLLILATTPKPDAKIAEWIGNLLHLS